MHELYGQSGLIPVKDLTWESESPVCCLIMDLIIQPEEEIWTGSKHRPSQAGLGGFRVKGNRNPCGLSPKNRKSMGLPAHRIDIGHA